MKDNVKLNSPHVIHKKLSHQPIKGRKILNSMSKVQLQEFPQHPLVNSVLSDALILSKNRRGIYKGTNEKGDLITSINGYEIIALGNNKFKYVPLKGKSKIFDIDSNEQFTQVNNLRSNMTVSQLKDFVKKAKENLNRQEKSSYHYFKYLGNDQYSYTDLTGKTKIVNKNFANHIGPYASIVQDLKKPGSKVGIPLVLEKNEVNDTDNLKKFIVMKKSKIDIEKAEEYLQAAKDKKNQGNFSDLLDTFSFSPKKVDEVSKIQKSKEGKYIYTDSKGYKKLLDDKSFNKLPFSKTLLSIIKSRSIYGKEIEIGSSEEMRQWGGVQIKLPDNFTIITHKD